MSGSVGERGIDLAVDAAMKTTFLLALLLGSFVSGCANDDTDGAASDPETASTSDDLTGATKKIDFEKGTIGGAKLGMTATALVAAMKGHPVVTKEKLNGSTIYERYRYGDSTNVHISYGNGPSTVFYVQTSDPNYRSASGVGIGSAYSEVKAIPNAACTADTFGAGKDVCYIEVRSGGFFIVSFKNHRVTEVAVTLEGGE